jgi:hypothetical protein
VCYVEAFKRRLLEAMGMSGGNDSQATTPATTSALKIAGAAVGGAAWVAVVGSAIAAARLEPLGVPPGPTVSVMPAEQRFVIGFNFLALPLLLGLAAYLVLLFLRPRNEPARRLNEPGQTPKGLIPILAVGAVAGVVIGVISDSAPWWGQALLVLLPFLTAVAIYFAIERSEGFAQAGLIIFAGVAVCAGVMALTFESGRDTRLDTTAVLRKDGSAISGFYLTRTSDAVYVLAPTLAGEGIEPPDDLSADATPPELADDEARCPKSQGPVRLRGDGDRCFLNELVAVPTDDIARVITGPRDIKVDALGYRAAASLARLARLPGDEPEPQATGQQSAGGG